MPAIGAAIAGIAGAIAGVASAIGAALAAAIGSIAGAIGATIGGIAGAIGSTLGSVASGIISVVSALGKGVTAPLFESAAAIASLVAKTAMSLGAGLVEAIGSISVPVTKTVTVTGKSLADAVMRVGKPLVEVVEQGRHVIGEIYAYVLKVIDPVATAVLTPIKIGLEVVYGAVQQVGKWVTYAFHPTARINELAAENPGLWEACAKDSGAFVNALEAGAQISTTEAFLLRLPDVLQTLEQVSTLKVLYDLTQGHASIGDSLSRVTGENIAPLFEAIVELSKGIITTSVAIMDKVDSEVEILRAGVDSLDERIRTSFKEMVAKTKAEVLAAVTPKMETLGRHQALVASGVARLSRHIEDEAWFGAMLVRMLR